MIEKLLKLATKYDINRQYRKADKIDEFMLRFAQYGEFWLMNGQAMGADGDIGDTNHEGMVIESILDSYELNNMKMLELEQKSLDEYGDRDTLLKELGMTDEELNAVRSLSDPREYGLKNFGWQRVKGTSVETQTLTSSELRDIANGLWDAYDEDVQNMEFDIEVRGNDTLYRDVPWEAIESENPTQLLPYRSKS